MQRSPGRSWHRPAMAPREPSPNLEAAPQRILQRRDAQGRFVREPGPRSVRDRETGCEVWIGPMRGNTPWDDGRAVLTTRYEARYGPLPPGHRLVRICNLPQCCVNLDHAVLLTPQQALLYRYAGREPVWLDQHEADEIHAQVAGLAERFGISLGALIAYARWPHGLAEALPDRDTPA